MFLNQDGRTLATRLVLRYCIMYFNLTINPLSPVRWRNHFTRSASISPPPPPTLFLSHPHHEQTRTTMINSHPPLENDMFLNQDGRTLATRLVLRYCIMYFNLTINPLSPVRWRNHFTRSASISPPPPPTLFLSHPHHEQTRTTMINSHPPLENDMFLNQDGRTLAPRLVLR